MWEPAGAADSGGRRGSRGGDLHRLRRGNTIYPGADPGGGRWGAHPPLGRSFTVQNALFNRFRAPVHHWVPTPGRNPVSAPDICPSTWQILQADKATLCLCKYISNRFYSFCQIETLICACYAKNVIVFNDLSDCSISLPQFSNKMDNLSLPRWSSCPFTEKSNTPPMGPGGPSKPATW